MSMATRSVELSSENEIDKVSVRGLNVEVDLANLSGVGITGACFDKAGSNECLSGLDQFLGGDRCFLYNLPTRGNSDILDDSQNPLASVIKLGSILHMPTLTRKAEQGKYAFNPVC